MKKRIEPGPGQESVWDYPRPPRVEEVPEQIRIFYNGETIAETTNGLRVLETSHPPTYYIPESDVKMAYLTKTPKRTFCEFKGAATYFTIEVDDELSANAAWSYEHPARGYERLQGHLCFYASRIDEAYVGDELVHAQEGDFYGGWITSKVVGPFKGGAGTWGW